MTTDQYAHIIVLRAEKRQRKTKMDQQLLLGTERNDETLSGCHGTLMYEHDIIHLLRYKAIKVSWLLFLFVSVVYIFYLLACATRQTVKSFELPRTLYHFLAPVIYCIVRRGRHDTYRAFASTKYYSETREPRLNPRALVFGQMSFTRRGY